MSVIIHCWTTLVHFNFWKSNWFECFCLSRKCVIYLHRLFFLSRFFIICTLHKEFGSFYRSHIMLNISIKFNIWSLFTKVHTHRFWNFCVFNVMKFYIVFQSLGDICTKLCFAAHSGANLDVIHRCILYVFFVLYR